MERVEDTREKLLEATLELISEKGYMGATTREIASRAGVCELTLFRRFGTKEQLFEEMLRRFTFLPRLRELVSEIHDMPVEEGLNTIGVRFLQTLRERRALVRILVSEISHYSGQVRTIHRQMIDNLVTILESYLEDPQRRQEVRSIDMNLAAPTFLRVLFMTYFHESILRENEMSDEGIRRTVKAIVEIFLDGIRAKGEVQGGKRNREPAKRNEGKFTRNRS
jgi:AcrR family transcriptional regulator